MTTTRTSTARSKGGTSAPTRPAKLYALWLLGRREWSAKELGQRLKLKGYPPEEVQACLELLAHHGFQDDARYAEVRVRSKARQLGNRRIKQDLTTKGIDADTAAHAMRELPDETQRAMAAASRFEGKPLTHALNAKAWRFMMARGFGSDAIKAALKRLAELEKSPAG